jgi:hypothetical protein
VIGQLGGIGRGERVYAVRFIDDLAYVVTFRQVDPLHVIDLSNPEQPVLRGELHIPGYSSYLHPIGDGLLMGIGQDATDQGQILGMQVSIFDVSDPADPRRLHHHSLGQGWSQAEWDHHAFLYDAQRRLAVMPFETSTWDEATGISSYWSGAIGLRVGRPGIEQLLSIEHPGIVYPVEPMPVEPDGGAGSPPSTGEETAPDVMPQVFPTPIQRSLVLGNTLYTLSEAGLKATSLETLAETGWVEFPMP